MADIDVLGQSRAWEFERLSREAEGARSLADAVDLASALKYVPLHGSISPHGLEVLMRAISLFPEVQEAVVGLARSHSEQAAKDARASLLGLVRRT